MDTSLNLTFTDAELLMFETLLCKLGFRYSKWILEELDSEHPSQDAVTYFESKVANVKSLLGDVRCIREGQEK